MVGPQQGDVWTFEPTSRPVRRLVTASTWAMWRSARRGAPGAERWPGAGGSAPPPTPPGGVEGGHGPGGDRRQALHLAVLLIRPEGIESTTGSCDGPRAGDCHARRGAHHSGGRRA
jgi:hypothetical protein